jgi:hypothetical protein
VNFSLCCHDHCMNYRTEDYKFCPIENYVRDLDGKRLFINEKEIILPCEIDEILENKNLLIVRHWHIHLWHPEEKPYRNIYAFNDRGEQVWQVKAISKYKSDEHRYIFYQIGIEEGYGLYGIQAGGTKYLINHEDGTLRFFSTFDDRLGIEYRADWVNNQI